MAKEEAWSKGRHQHSQACFSTKVVCGYYEYSHTSKCYDKDGKLTCPKGEHTHGERCLLQATICGKEQWAPE